VPRCRRQDIRTDVGAAGKRSVMTHDPAAAGNTREDVADDGADTVSRGRTRRRSEGVIRRLTSVANDLLSDSACSADDA